MKKADPIKKNETLTSENEPTIVLFTGDNYSKKSSQKIHTDIAKLPKGIDNEVSSCIVYSGTWVLFHHPNFHDPSHKPLGPGYYPNAHAMGIANNAVSSVRPI